MKRIIMLISIFLLAVMVFTGCQTNQPQGPSEVPIPDEQIDDVNEGEDEEEDIRDGKKEIYGIFYGYDEDKADILILDPSIHGNNPILLDDARVFFSDKEMNSLVKLWVEVKEQRIDVYDAEMADEATTVAKYIGFADSNFAEFQILDNPFVVQVPSDLASSLENINTNELLEITIIPNEIEGGNTVLKNVKRGSQ